jgi:hypothetical protein
MHANACCKRLTDRCAKKVKFPGPSIRPRQRRIGPSEASAEGGRQRGSRVGCVAKTHLVPLFSRRGASSKTRRTLL